MPISTESVRSYALTSFNGILTRVPYSISFEKMMYLPYFLFFFFFLQSKSAIRDLLLRYYYGNDHNKAIFSMIELQATPRSNNLIKQLPN